MRFTRRRKFDAGAALAVLGLRVVGALAYSLVAHAVDKGDPRSFTDTFRGSPLSVSQHLVDLGQTTEKSTLTFGQGGGKATDEAQIEARANSAWPLQVGSTGLRGSAGTIGARMRRLRWT